MKKSVQKNLQAFENKFLRDHERKSKKENRQRKQAVTKKAADQDKTNGIHDSANDPL